MRFTHRDLIHFAIAFVVGLLALLGLAALTAKAADAQEVTPQPTQMIANGCSLVIEPGSDSSSGGEITWYCPPVTTAPPPPSTPELPPELALTGFTEVMLWLIAAGITMIAAGVFMLSRRDR